MAAKNVLNDLTEDDARAVYGHEPLARDEIHILEIHPKSNEPLSAPTPLFGSQPQISCELRRVALSDKSSYVALSYHWGDTKRTASVLVNGTMFKIT
jgi:hypothetical protein